MKQMLMILFILSAPIFVGAQVIDWKNFDEKHMDTVMFNVMNSYRNQEFGDSIVWSPLVQGVIMPNNYDFIKCNESGVYFDITPLHNMKWVKNDVSADLKNKIIKENVNPYFFNNKIREYEYISNEGNVVKGSVCNVFKYREILAMIPGNKRGCETYQKLANHTIHSWKKSDPHAEVMDWDYKNKVIVGTITYYSKETHRVFISFVYVN